MQDLAGESPLPATAKLALVGEVLASYVRARASLRRSGLRGTVAALRAIEPRQADTGAETVSGGRRLGRVVRRTLAALPGDSRCLAQSLTLTRMLAARGVQSRLVIGVRAGEPFAAHAWVERGGVPLLPPGGDDFEELVTL